MEDQGERTLIQLMMPPTRAKIRLEPGRRREKSIHVGAGEIRKRDKIALHTLLEWGSRRRTRLTRADERGRRPL